MRTCVEKMSYIVAIITLIVINNFSCYVVNFKLSLVVFPHILFWKYCAFSKNFMKEDGFSLAALANIYLFKVAIETLEKCVRFIQS